MSLRSIAFALLLVSASAFAAPHQDPAAIHKAVDNFLRSQNVGLPGEVELQISPVDPRLMLPDCAQLQPFTPAGARPWGRTSIGVRCLGATPWTIYVAVQIQVTGNYLVAARSLAQGHILRQDDLVFRVGDLAQLPPGILVEPAQGIGKVMANSIASGEPLRQDMMRAPLILQSNQPVKIISRGKGFVVSGEGRALSNAGDGQTVQVRTLSGQVIAGIVRPGPLVEVMF
ncbi:MAG: flagellar basal body P-ring formation chaperone FlgA [Georgfuchsia sp.]